ncbi:MAG: SseB family protein [Clostridia bacterium]|nr:SseB family protein [Clostridia bacterium]
MSFLNNLRKLVGMKPTGDDDKTLQVKDKIRGLSFTDLLDRYNACEDEAEKAVIFTKLCKALPDSLFLCVFCYDGEDPNARVNDRTLHATQGSKRLYAVNQDAVTSGNPGYRLAKKTDSRRMHLRTLVNNKTKQEWVPLFTNFSKLLPVFGTNFRIALISFEEAKVIAKPYAGIIINHGKDSIKLSAEELKTIR